MSTMNKIQSAKFVAICEKLGLNVVRQPSQWKITGEDPNRRFYIPGTKAVHKVELSGWSHDLAILWTDVYPGKKAPSSKITHIVDFNQDEKLVLRSFFKMAKSLVAKAKRAPVAPSSPEVAPPVTEPVNELAVA